MWSDTTGRRWPVNPIVGAITAGALTLAESLISRGYDFSLALARLQNDYPAYSADVLGAVLDLAHGAVNAAELLQGLAPGEILDPENIPINPALGAGVTEADVVIDWRDPSGRLQSMRFGVALEGGATLEGAIEAATEAAAEGVAGYEALGEGVTVLDTRVVGVYRGA